MRNVVFVMLFMSFSMTARRMELSQANFSPLGIRLPWLRAPTDPKQRMRNMFFAVCVCVCICERTALFIYQPAFQMVHETSCILEASVPL